MYARAFAQVVGVVLLLLGVVGLFIGDYFFDSEAGLNSHIIEDIIHIVLGAVLAYVGFANVDRDMLRTTVGVVGIVLLIVAIIGFIDRTFLGLFQDAPYTITDNITHLVLGLGGAVAGFLTPADRTTTRDVV